MYIHIHMYIKRTHVNYKCFYIYTLMERKLYIYNAVEQENLYYISKIYTFDLLINILQKFNLVGSIGKIVVTIMDSYCY